MEVVGIEPTRTSARDLQSPVPPLEHHLQKLLLNSYQVFNETLPGKLDDTIVALPAGRNYNYLTFLNWFPYYDFYAPVYTNMEARTGVGDGVVFSRRIKFVVTFRLTHSEPF